MYVLRYVWQREIELLVGKRTENTANINVKIIIYSMTKNNIYSLRLRTNFLFIFYRNVHASIRNNVISAIQ